MGAAALRKGGVAVRVRVFVGLFLALAIVCKGVAAAPDPLRLQEAVEAVRLECSQDVVLDIGAGGALVAMHDAGWSGPGTPREVADAFVGEHHVALGLDAVPADLRVVREVASHGTTMVYLQQFVGGQPVLNGRLDVFVRNGLLTGLNNRLVPEDVIPSARLSRGDAGLLLSVGGRLRRVLEVAVEGPDGGRVRHLVDEETGEVLERRRLDLSLDGEGLSFDPDPINFAPLLPPLSLTPHSPDSAFTARMNVAILRDISTDGLGRFVLTGPHVTIVDSLPTVPGPPFTPPAVPTADGFVFARTDERFSSVNIYRHLDESARFIHGTLGFPQVMAYPVKVKPHADDDDARYVSLGGGQGGIMFGDSNIVPLNFGEDGDTVLHEQGHAIHDNQSHGRYFPTGRETAAQGEGFSDFWACARTYDRSVANGANPAWFGDWLAQANPRPDANRLFARTVDGDKHYPEDLEGEEHADGEIWSAALWTVFAALPDAAARNEFLTIALQSHFLVPDQPTFRQGARALLDANAQLLPAVADLRPQVRQSMLSRGIFVDLPPTELKGEFASGGNRITWRNNSDVTGAIQVLRDSMVVATLPRAATSYLDPVPPGTRTYQVASVNTDDPMSLQVSAPLLLADGSGGTSVSPGAGGACFIATAAYGTSTEEHVVTLRRFRDRTLLATPPGRWVVAVYYDVSPPLADWIREREWARAAVRAGLTPMTWAIEAPAGAGAGLMAALLLLLVLLGRRRRAPSCAPGRPQAGPPPAAPAGSPDRG